MTDTYEPATPEQVFMAVEAALRRQFGASAELVQVSFADDSAVFGFTVDGVNYSLEINVTP